MELHKEPVVGETVIHTGEQPRGKRLEPFSVRLLSSLDYKMTMEHFPADLSWLVVTFVSRSIILP